MNEQAVREAFAKVQGIRRELMDLGAYRIVRVDPGAPVVLSDNRDWNAIANAWDREEDALADLNRLLNE